MKLGQSGLRLQISIWIASIGYLFCVMTEEKRTEKYMSVMLGIIIVLLVVVVIIVALTGL